MKILKRIILLVLFTVSVNSVVLVAKKSRHSHGSGGNCENNELNLANMPIYIRSQIFSNLFDLNVNKYDGLEKAVARLCKLRRICRSFQSMLTPEVMAHILLSAGLDIKRRFEDGGTLLHIAVKKNNVSVVRVLLKAVPVQYKASFIGAEDSWGVTALHLAVRSPDIMNILLAEVPENQRFGIVMVPRKITETILHSAASTNGVEAVNEFLKYFSKQQIFNIVMIKNGSRLTALQEAVRNGYDEFIEAIFYALSLEHVISILKNEYFKPEYSLLELALSNKYNLVTLNLLLSYYNYFGVEVTQDLLNRIELYRNDYMNSISAEVARQRHHLHAHCNIL